MKPTGRQLSRTLPSPSPEPPANNQHTRLEPSPFDFNFLDEAGANQRPSIQPPKNNYKGKGSMQVDHPTKTPVHRGGDSSDEYGFMDDENDFADASFLGDLDRVEKAALEASYSSLSVPRSSSMSGSGGVSSSLASSYVMVDKGKGTTKPTGEQAIHASDVIEIDDSDEEMLEADDKENQPVPTRHVRRRTEDGIAGPAFTLPSQPQSQRMSQKSKRPVVLATNPEDIIDLSD
jgi:RecQ-mediated genome instability protein 1